MTDKERIAELESALEQIATVSSIALTATGEHPIAAVAGDRLTTSLAAFGQKCLTLIRDEERKPSPDNHLIDCLCEAVRLCREYSPTGENEHPDTVRLDELECAMKADNWTRIAMDGLRGTSGLCVVPTACHPGACDGEDDYPDLRSAIDALPEVIHDR